MIAIVDYKAGNLTSVRLALEHLGIPATVTQDPAVIARADRVIFPGVGAAGSAMEHLAELQLAAPLHAAVDSGKPFLGICLGTQVIFDRSEEDGGTDCLGIVPGAVKQFRPSDPLCKVPQMGWNTVELRVDHPVFSGIEDDSEFYFVHSFYPGSRRPDADLRPDGVRRRSVRVRCGPGQPYRDAVSPGTLGPDRTQTARKLQYVGRNMLTKRIIPCLDIRNRKVTKGVKFQNNIDLGDPIEMAVAYSDGGADELVFYDITASAEGRPIDIEMVREIGKVVHIPFAVGGGLKTVEDMYSVLDAGAEKVSVNSLAVDSPEIIPEMSRVLGRQNVVLGMDPVRTDDTATCPSGYEITTRGFRRRTGMDALDWAKRAEELGVGEIVVNSVDADGTRDGFELALTKLIATSVGIPVVASGGAGVPQHLVDVFQQAHADAAIVASMTHMGHYTIQQIKDELDQAGVPVRKKW